VSQAASFPCHHEHATHVAAPAEELFTYLDDQSRLSSHMSQSSWMMAGGRMHIATDDRRGREVGSHIRLSGKVLGIELSLDEVVTERVPPHHKAWETIGEPNLLVIGRYRMGFDVTPDSGGCLLRVYIDYDLPAGPAARWLGYLLGPLYAKWCVRQMAEDARNALAATHARATAH
jgi:Polyketide cyclase / dehydrase and lipid transport